MPPYQQELLLDKAWDWLLLNGEDWSALLRAQPMLADKCDWSKLDEFEWAELLVKRPQFADKCDKWGRWRTGTCSS